MSDDLWLWAWGGAGALLFAGPALGAKLFADPGDDSASDRRRRRLALFNFMLAVLTGAISAQVFAAPVADWLARLVAVHPPAAAVIVGISANALWPKIVRRLGGFVDQIKLPGGA